MPEIERELRRAVAVSRRGHRVAARYAGAAVATLVTAAVIAAVLISVIHHRTKVAARPARAPVGSVGHPAVLGCSAEAGIDTPLRRSPQDLVVGPVWFPDAKHLPTAHPSGYGQHGTYKIPPAIAAGATVTLTIARPARRYVVMRNPYLQHAATSITYHACAHQHSFFPQSFSFTDGRIRGCIPLDIRSAPSDQIRHVTLRLFVRRCGGQR